MKIISCLVLSLSFLTMMASDDTANNFNVVSDVESWKKKIDYSDPNKIIGYYINMHGSKDQCSALHAAVLNHDVDVARQLLENGAAADCMTGNSKVTPLMLSVIKHSVEIMILLLAN